MKIPDYKLELMVACLLIGAVATLVIFGVRDCNQQGYNFHTVFMPVSCGSGCVVMVPYEVSDWRCVVTPEKPR